MTKISLVFITLISFYFVGCGSVKDLAQNNLYPVDYANKQKPVSQTPEGYQSVHLDVPISHPTEDDKESHMSVHLWSYHQPDTPRAPVVVYFHGNGVNIAGLWKSQFLKRMETLQTHFVVMDYPSYGESTGYPTQFSIMDGAHATLEYVKQTFPQSKIIIWGRSLGAAVATKLVDQTQLTIQQLILTSPWSTLYDVMLFHYEKLIDKLPQEWFDLNQWDSMVSAQKIHLPILIHHGNKDQVIPFQFGEKLMTQFQGPKRLIPIEGKGHNDILGLDQLWYEVSEFIVR